MATVATITTRGGATRRPWAETAAKAPAPVRNCDGTLRVPMWSPDRGWELGTFHGDDEPAAMGKSRAQCSDPDCEALHVEEVEAWAAAKRRAAAQGREFDASAYVRRALRARGRK